MEEVAPDIAVSPLEGDAEKAPDKTLAQLYQSSRPPVDLLPGVSLSALVNTAWLPGDAKVARACSVSDRALSPRVRLALISRMFDAQAMLAETWMPAPAEPEEGAAPAAPPPSFDPRSIEYKVISPAQAIMHACILMGSPPSS